MAENKEYFSKEVENGSIQISEEVVSSVAAMAVLEVEGVCGLASNLGYDIAEMLGKKTLAKGVRMSTEGDALQPLTVRSWRSSGSRCSCWHGMCRST